MKLLKAIVALQLVLGSAYAQADNHSSAPMGYGLSYLLKVSDPAAIAGAMTEVRTTDLGKDSPSSVVLNELVAGGERHATHTIGVFYQSGEAIDKAAAMNRAMRVGEKVGPIFQASSERIGVGMWTLLRVSAEEGAVTSENPVSMGYLLAVSDVPAFMAAFDPLWESVTASFPGNVSFGGILADGTGEGTHWVNFSANDMATLLAGIQAMQSSPEMAAYMQAAPSFRTVVSESVNRRLLNFPQSQ